MVRQALRVAGFALACAPVVSASANAQEPAGGAVTSATVRVDLSRPGATAHVRIDYRLTVPGATTTVPLTALVDWPLLISDLSARTPTRVLDIRLPEADGPLRVGDVDLGSDVSEGPLLLTIEYEIARAISFDDTDVFYRVPLVVVDWPPSDPRPGTFLARASVQPDIWIHEAFPTTLAGPIGPPGTSEWQLELSVLPVYLKLRGKVAATAPFLSVPRVVDASVLLVLLLLGFVGLQRLRRAL